MTLPLSGVRIVDFSRLLPGPFCTMLLADLGAEVIKVEDTRGGDYARYYPPLVEGVGVFFASINRNKSSISLDLKIPQAVLAARRLIATADVVVESFRPGVMSRLGLGYEDLAQDQLIYCAISGYGQTGPLADRAGHDMNYMAHAGLLDQNGTQLTGPQVPGFQLADIAGGSLYAALGITTALFARERGQGGRFIDISMTEGALTFATPLLATAAAGGDVAPGAGMLSGGIAAYNVYKTSDGRYLSVGALEPKFWTGFVAAIGAPELVGDGHSADPNSPARRRVAAIIASKPLRDWRLIFADLDLCVEPVLTAEEVLQSQLNCARERFFTLAGVAHTRTPLTPKRVHEPAPGLGEHTLAILADLGYSEADVDAMRVAGALAT